MPRKRPLPETEFAIGRRLAQARKEALIPRAALAVKVGISTERLYSYEVGRAKLPWGVGERACKILDIHPSWLAGANAFGMYVEYDLSNITAEELEAAPFSEIYTRVFAPVADREATVARAKITATLQGLERSFQALTELGGTPTAADVARLKQLAAHVKKLAARMARGPRKKRS